MTVLKNIGMLVVLQLLYVEEIYQEFATACEELIQMTPAPMHTM